MSFCGKMRKGYLASVILSQALIIPIVLISLFFASLKKTLSISEIILGEYTKSGLYLVKNSETLLSLTNLKSRKRAINLKILIFPMSKDKNMEKMYRIGSFFSKSNHCFLKNLPVGLSI